MEYVLLSIAGLAAGVLGGLLGVGGSVVMIPAMVWILGATGDGGREMIHQYQAAAMIVNFLLAIPSVAAHARNKAIWWRVCGVLAATALVGVVVGVQVSWLFTDGAATYLRWAVGAFFIYVAVYNAYRILMPARREGLPRQQVEAMALWRKGVVGLPMGLVAGLLGIGGGSLAVPTQQILLEMPLRNAIATSSATIAAITWLGAVLKNAQLGGRGSVTESFILVAALAPTAMIGSYVGGHLTHILPLKLVRIVFTALMLLAAYKMIIG